MFILMLMKFSRRDSVSESIFYLVFNVEDSLELKLLFPQRLISKETNEEKQPRITLNVHKYLKQQSSSLSNAMNILNYCGAISTPGSWTSSLSSQIGSCFLFLIWKYLYRPATGFEIRSFASLSPFRANCGLGRSRRSVNLSFFVNRNRSKS